MRFCVAAIALLATSACSGTGGNNASGNVSGANLQQPARPSIPTAWQTTPSGLKYRRIEGDGSGPKPRVTDTITFHYVGRLADGTEFDSSLSRGEPTTMSLGGVIPGWQEGVPLMSVGDVYEFEIPSALGYGARQSGPIPANSTLYFTIGLLGIGG